MAAELPAHLSERTRHLGPLIDHFPTGLGAWRYIAAVPFVGFALLPLVGMIQALSKGERSQAVALLFCSLVFLGFALAGGLYLRWLRQTQVWLFANGLACVRGSRAVVWSWDQIETVLQNIRTPVAVGALQAALTPSRRVFVVTLRGRDGVQFRFAALQRSERLVEAIVREHLQQRLPEVRAQYQTGAPVFFDRLGVSTQGVHDGHAVLPWPEVQEVKLLETTPSPVVAIAKKGKNFYWSKVRLAEVPNGHVFVALAQEIQASRP
jgi:hypothetical protein